MAKFRPFTTSVLLFVYFLLTFLSQTSANVPLNEFFPYGVEKADDISMKSGERRDGDLDDGSSEKLPLQIAFPFFNALHDSLWVNINGVISFRSVIGKYSPLCQQLSAEFSMIAPFWADVTLDNGGDVLHRETFDPATLNKATAEVVTAFPELSSIEMKWALVATWKDVVFYGCCQEGCSKKNTFQVVLTTDGIRSFAILNYHNITWTTGTARSSAGDCFTGKGGVPAKAGFDAGDGKSFFTIPGSCEDDIATVDERSNVGVPGKWIFRVDSSEVQSAGCNSDTFPNIRLVPSFIGLYGHVPVKVYGPCFNKDTAKLTCRFHDPIKGVIEVTGKAVGSEGNRAAECLAPFFYGGGRIRVDFVLDDAQTLSEWSSFLYVLPPNLATSEKLNVSEKRMTDDTLELEFHWKVEDFHFESGDRNALLDLNILELTAVAPEWTKMATLASAVPNNGHLTVNIGDRDDLHFDSGHLSTYLFALEASASSRKKRDPLGSPSAETLITDGKEVLTVYAKSKWAERLCIEWYKADTESFDLSEFSQLPPCPPTVNQYKADSNRWTEDAACNEGSKNCVFHSGANFCIRSRLPAANGAGQQCCYKDDVLYTDFRGGGTVDRYHSSGKFYFNSLLHLIYDVRPWFYCCHEESDDLCALYKERRYTDTGINYRSPRAAGGRGDPHITTFDGTGYTFNGAGEFWLLKGSSMKVQSRMEPFGDKSATVFTAFVMKSTNSSTVQIEKVPIRRVDVLVDGVQMDFSNPLLLDVAFKDVQVTVKEDFSSVSVAFACGFTFYVDISPNALSIFATAEEKNQRRSQTAGLLGLFDGDASNDLTDPEGHVYSVNSSMKTLHYDFGLKWLVKQSESLFNYTKERSFEYFFKPEFVPNFNQPNISSASLEAQQVCSQSSECLYDFMTTENKDIAYQTKDVSDAFTEAVDIFKREVLTCKPLKIPQNGILRADNFMPGSVAIFSCLSGHTLTGNQTITCSEDGFWTGTEPVCSNGISLFQVSNFLIFIFLFLNIFL